MSIDPRQVPFNPMTAFEPAEGLGTDPHSVADPEDAVVIAEAPGSSGDVAAAEYVGPTSAPTETPVEVVDAFDDSASSASLDRTSATPVEPDAR